MHHHDRGFAVLDAVVSHASDEELCDIALVMLGNYNSLQDLSMTYVYKSILSVSQ